jgi:hypothetical protein
VEECQDGDLAGREFDHLSVASGAEFFWINRDRSHGEGLARAGTVCSLCSRRTAEGAADPCEEFVTAEGFPHEVVGTEFEAHDDVDLFVLGREENDRGRGERAARMRRQTS